MNAGVMYHRLVRVAAGDGADDHDGVDDRGRFDASNGDADEGANDDRDETADAA